jgi:tetratricopeptide (TPR) repeat protein
MQGVLHVIDLQTNIRVAVHFSSRSLERFIKSNEVLAKLDTSHLPANARALLLCERALELKERGEFDAAREVMRPLWPQLGQRPNTEGLNPVTTAEVLLCAGVLTSWIGGQNQIKEADEWARDCLTESMRIFETEKDAKKVAQVQTEIAYCYRRAGALDEARIWFINALQKLIIEGNARANALLGLSVVEWSLARYDEAFEILTDNARLFRKINSHSLKGFYHNQLAMVLRSVAPSHNREAYYKRALREYEAAEIEFKLARNTLFRADVNNNRGFLLYKLSRFRQAHQFLNEARRLALVVRNKVVVAQIDDTRAQVFIAEKKYTEAEAVARAAAASLRKSGHLGLLIDTLITHGIALARLSKREKAEFNFREGIEIAHQIGVLSKAGIASLTLIEEIDRLPPDVLAHAYQQAAEWMSNCQSEALLSRFRQAGSKLALELLREKGTKHAPTLFNMPIDLDNEVLMFERELIRQALAKVEGGSVVDAAKWLGISYQLLAHRIRTKHPELDKVRSPVRRRPGRNIGKRRK